MENHKDYLDIYGWNKARWDRTMHGLNRSVLASLHRVLLSDLEGAMRNWRGNWTLNGADWADRFVHSHDAMMPQLKALCTEFNLDKEAMARYLPAFLQIEIRPFSVKATVTHNRHRMHQDLTVAEPGQVLHITLFSWDPDTGTTQDNLGPWHTVGLRWYHCDWCFTEQAKVGLYTTGLVTAPSTREPTYGQVAELAITPHLMSAQPADCTCCQTARARRVVPAAVDSGVASSVSEDEDSLPELE